MSQEIFSPIQFGFEWTEDWYTFDSAAAHKQARKARDARVRELRAQGRTVRCFSMSGQLVTRGGIGSGHPQIEQIVSVYGLNTD